MNTERPASPEADHFKSLQILDELSSNDSITQRDLSKRLGIALGLVNSYIKNLVKKGYITVKAIPPKRYAYYLTPKGLTEKTRLTYHLLHDYTRIYREAKSNLKELFKEMSSKGVKKVVLYYAPGNQPRTGRCCRRGVCWQGFFREEDHAPECSERSGL
jgi:DNA-binding MarR family transcriptional regulator